MGSGRGKSLIGVMFFAKMMFGTDLREEKQIRDSEGIQNTITVHISHAFSIS